MKLKRCLHMRFQETGLGAVSTWFLIHTSRSQWIGSPQFSLRSGWSSHTIDPSCAVSGHRALGRHHNPCHHPGTAHSLPPAYYTCWQRQTILLGSRDRAPGQVLVKVGGYLCSQQHQVLVALCSLQTLRTPALAATIWHFFPSLVMTVLQIPYQLLGFVLIVK